MKKTRFQVPAQRKTTSAQTSCTTPGRCGNGRQAGSHSKRYSVVLRPKPASAPTVSMQFLAPCPGKLHVEVNYYDGDGTELTRNRHPLNRPAAMVSLVRHVRTSNHMEARAAKVASARYTDSLDLVVPRDLLRHIRTIGMSVTPLSTSGAEGEAMHIHRRKHKMAFGAKQKANYAILLPASEANDRIELLMMRTGLLATEEEWARIARDSIMRRVRSGADTPLLAVRLEDHAEQVDKMLRNYVKTAKYEAFRRQLTRSGLARGERRVVEDICPNQIPAPQEEQAPEPSGFEREMRITLSLIREFSSDEKKQELVLRGLLGEPMEPLSMELGINYGTARSIMSRARKFLFPTL